MNNEDFIITIPEAERKIATMRVIIEEIVATYRTLCESAQSEAPGWQADSRATFETKMLAFEERCLNLKEHAETLFDAQGEYFKRIIDANGEYNNR